MWPEVPTDPTYEKQTWTITRNYWITIDLRTDQNTESKENILWETYENTKVQILEKDETKNLYLIKIEKTEKNITPEIFSTHYARLYPNFTIENLTTLQNWIAGRINWDFIKEDSKDYSTNQNLNYPFDYQALSSSWRTTDQLVTQIFFEEFNGTTHQWLDFNLLEWEEVKWVTNWIVKDVEWETVIIYNNDSTENLFSHIIPNVNIWDKVTTETIIWKVKDDIKNNKAHLHFELKDQNWKNLNPAKYFKVYNAWDSHKCMRELIVEKAIYDGKVIKELCGVWLFSPPKDYRCELWKTWDYWVRPYYSDCTDENTKQAWECYEWYTDFYSKKYWFVNTCIKNEYVDFVLKFNNYRINLLHN
jgi:hypothetical protein